MTKQQPQEQETNRKPEHMTKCLIRWLNSDNSISIQLKQQSKPKTSINGSGIMCLTGELVQEGAAVDWKTQKNVKNQ